MKYLFPDFLTDENQYREAQEFWATTFREELPAEQRSKWEPWFAEPIHHDDQSATMFTAWDKSANKALKIVQLPPAGSAPDFGARLDWFGLNHLEQPIMFLAVWCELSPAVVPKIRKLLRLWVTPQTTQAQVEDAISRL